MHQLDVYFHGCTQKTGKHAAKLILTANNANKKELEERATRLKPSGPPHQPSPVERMIHFLRGVNSRASFALPAFYFFLASNSGKECDIEGYPGVVLKCFLAFSPINTISLACRKVFDNKTNGLTGARFTKITDETLIQVASYWARQSNQESAEATNALLKQHANHEAAHISL